MLLTFLLCAAGLPAASQSVRTYLSVDSVRVGDRFYLTVVAEHSNPGSPLFPGAQAGEDVFGDLEVLGIRSQGTLDAGTSRMRVDSLIYEVTTFALDTAYVPSIPVFFVTDADTSFLASSPLYLPIVSLVPPDAEDIRDLAPLAEFPASVWPWILGFVLLAAAGAAGYYYWKRRSVEAPVILQAPVREVPPYEEALSRLRALEKSANLKDIQRVKPFYVELTEILRVYLGRRLRIHAMENTSLELLRDLNRLALRKKISSDVVYLTKRVLHVSDLVKFADMRPPPEVGKQALLETRKILDAVEESLRPAVPAPVVEPAPAVAHENGRGDE